MNEHNHPDPEYCNPRCPLWDGKTTEERIVAARVQQREAWDEGYRAAMTASIGLQGRPNVGAPFPADWLDKNPYREAKSE